MRVLFGIILGGILTVGAAYLHDHHRAVTTEAAQQQPLVNWTQVSREWERLADRARNQWQRVAG